MMRPREPIFGMGAIVSTCAAFGNMAISSWQEYPNIWGVISIISFATIAVCVVRSIYRDRIA